MVDKHRHVTDVDYAVTVHVTQHEVIGLKEEVHPLVGSLVEFRALVTGSNQRDGGLIHTSPHALTQFGNIGGSGLQGLHACHTCHGRVAQEDNRLGKAHGVDLVAHVVESVVTDGGNALLEHVAGVEVLVAGKGIIADGTDGHVTAGGLPHGGSHAVTAVGPVGMGHIGQRHGLEQAVVGQHALANAGHAVSEFQGREAGLCKSPVTQGHGTQRVDIDALQTRVDEGFTINHGDAASGVKLDSLQGRAAIEGTLADAVHTGSHLHVTQVDIAQEGKLANVIAVDVGAGHILTAREHALAHVHDARGQRHTGQGSTREGIVANQRHRLRDGDAAQLVAARKRGIADSLQTLGQHDRGEFLAEEGRARNRIAGIVGHRAIEHPVLVVGGNRHLTQVECCQLIQVVGNEQEVTGIHRTRHDKRTDIHVVTHGLSQLARCVVDIQGHGAGGGKYRYQ